MTEIVSKEEFDELMKIKGESRGGGINVFGEFIFKEEGEEGLKKLEKAIKEIGYPINFKEMRSMDFYPLGLEALVLLVIKRIFDYDDEKIKEIGSFEPKTALILKLFMKYFGSIDLVANKAPEMWKKYYTVGDLKVIELNKEKKYIILRLENFRLHPIHCLDLFGYFSAVVQMVVKSKNVICQETKCLFRGDEYHEFLIRW